MPLLAGIGVLGGLLRDLAPDPDEIWRFSLLRPQHLPLLQGKQELPPRRAFTCSSSRASWSPKALRRGMARFLTKKDVFYCSAPPARPDLHP